MIHDFEAALAARLLAWGGLSTTVGVGLLLASEDPFVRGFATMAVVWGLVDAAIAAVAGRGARRGRTRAPDRAAREREAAWLGRVLLVNVWLDVGYLLVGAWLLAVPGAADAFTAGAGAGVLVQGGVLLGIDLLHLRLLPRREAEPPPLSVFEGPEHRPFRLEPAGPPVGVAVLLHGFGGTPAEMRPLGEALAGAGWSVTAPLLPGFGPDLPRVTERRYEDWVAATQATVEAALAPPSGDRPTTSGSTDASAGTPPPGPPLLLLGHSMGAPLVLAAARSAHPAGIVLVAPFWWDEPAWQRLLAPFAPILLPPGVRPFRRIDLDDPRVRAGLAGLIGDLDLDDDGVRTMLRDVEIPLGFVASIRDGTRRAPVDAAASTVPALVVQGLSDEAATPARTRKLVAAFGRSVTYVEVDTGHGLVLETDPGWPAVRDAVLAHAATVAGAHHGLSTDAAIGGAAAR